MNFIKLKSTIEKNKFSINAISEKIGMTAQGLSASIKNETLKVRDLEKIAEVLKIDVREFFDENNANSSEKNFNHNQVMFGNGTQTNNSNNDQRMSITECEKEVAHLRERLRDLEQTIVDKNDIISLLKNK